MNTATNTHPLDLLAKEMAGDLFHDITTGYYMPRMHRHTGKFLLLLPCRVMKRIYSCLSVMQ